MQEGRPKKKFDTGEGLRYWRNRRGLSQERLAQLIGCTQPEISMIENGERDWSSQWQRNCAEVLGITIEALMSKDPAGQEQNDQIMAMLQRVPAAERPRAAQVIGAFAEPTREFRHDVTPTPPPRRRRRA